MNTEQELYKQAVTAIQAGDLAKGREILSQLLKIDKSNINYWLWMSAAVETTKERVYCLREVLIRDPENQEAALGLRMLGEKAPELKAAGPRNPEFIAWKTSLELADEHPAAQRGLRSRVALYAVLGAAIIAIFGGGIYLAMHSTKPKDNTSILRFTITPVPTATETLTPTPTPTGPAPYSIVLAQTFTPTPLFVATPHNRLEAYSSAMRAYDKGDWSQAEGYLQQVLVDEPNSPDIYYHLGDAYRFEGKYSDAMTAYQKAISIDANFAPAYLGVGQIYLYNSPTDPADALTALQKAITLDPTLYQAYLEMANVSISQNDADNALGWLSKLDTVMPNNALVELDRAKAYVIKGQNDQALAAIQKAHQYDPSLLEEYKVWGEILQADGNYAGSIEPLLTVQVNAPLDLGSKVLLARAYYETGSVDKALTMVNECLQKDNKFTAAYLLRADIELDQGQDEDARTDFNAVLRYDPNNFDANIGIGRYYLSQTLAGAAYNAFDNSEKLAKTNPQKAAFLYWRGKSLIGLQETSAAIRDLEAALAVPDNALPQKLHGDAELQLMGLYTPTPSPTPAGTSTPETFLTPSYQ